MKPYSVQIEVRILYTVEVHADSPKKAVARSWDLDFDEVEARGSAEMTEITAVSHVDDIEEIQQEDDGDE